MDDTDLTSGLFWICDDLWLKLYGFSLDVFTTTAGMF
jgi:hypothetical protein